MTVQTAEELVFRPMGDHANIALDEQKRAIILPKIQRISALGTHVSR
jgi:hypothetical protein